MVRERADYPVIEWRDFKWEKNLIVVRDEVADYLPPLTVRRSGRGKPLDLALQNRGKSDAWPIAVRILGKMSRENSCERTYL
jgi:hypothetical protein